MEVVIQSSEGMPEGGVLSIKVGETKRQAPVNKAGQSFRFATSLAEPLPMKVELLQPAAPPQLLTMDPSTPQVDVHFGHRMKVQLQQREVKDLQRPLVDVAAAAEAHGLPSEKMHMAQKAASYLEEHDLVRTFQEMLHGLLVAKPEDPHQYIEERLARAKRLSDSKKGKPAGLPPSSGPSPSPEDQDELDKLRAQAALDAAMMARPASTDDKLQAQRALDAAMMARPTSTDDKLQAQRALDAAMMARPASTDDKLQAQRALEAAMGRPASTDDKMLAQSVLENNMMQDTSSSSAPAASGPAPAAQGRSAAGRASTGSVCLGKVESLFTVLQQAHDNLKIVIPFLPKELRELLTSDGFEKECKKHFRSLDVYNNGQLNPADLQPVIVELTTAKHHNVNLEQCRRFCEMFDANQDGVICLNEFTELVRFVVAAGYMESEEGKAAIELAKVEEGSFEEFLQILEADKERLWTILPFLPKWLVEHVTGDAFQLSCNAHFDELDVDKSGALEPHELVSVIQSLSEAHPLVIDLDKCRRFAKVFDIYGNGVILRDEFLEFAQFLTVMNFMANTEEGKEVKQRAQLETESMRLGRFIRALQEDPTRESEILHHLPQALVRELTGEAYKKACLEGFRDLDQDGNGVLDPAELHPVVCHLMEAHPFHVTLEDCRRFTNLFDKDRNGVICEAEFPQLARYITIMGYLVYAKDHQDMLVQEVLIGREQIQHMMEILRSGVDQLHEIVPYLPEDLLAELGSLEFEAQCAKDFVDLDKDKSGFLEPKELVPVILHLSEAHHYALTEEHCRQFVDMFDTARNGVITREEFLSLTRFMMVMAFLETRDDYNEHMDDELCKRKNMRNSDEVVEGQQAVEELLHLLEGDRRCVHKVVPLLPADVYQELTSDRFVVSCHAQFEKLDREKNGVLTPQDLYPIIVSMSQAHPFAVTEEQCIRFTKIFDLDGNGVLQKDEFLDFARFLCIMSYLHTPQGKEAAAEALPILKGSKRIEELIKSLARDRMNIKKVIPYLPSWLRHELLSEHFTVECLDFFVSLDKDGNGSLDPQELYPMVLAVANVHHLSCDIAQCKRFTAIFDDSGTGVISKSEFVDFSRFMLIMSFLDSQEGQKVLSLAEQEIERGGALAIADRAGCPVGRDDPVDRDVQALKAQNNHLTVDCDFYRGKADRLSSENDDLRQKLSMLESSFRQMQSKMDEQEIRLRHAEVQMRPMGGTR